MKNNRNTHKVRTPCPTSFPEFPQTPEACPQNREGGKFSLKIVRPLYKLMLLAMSAHKILKQLHKFMALATFAQESVRHVNKLKDWVIIAQEILISRTRNEVLKD
jgi:hypothetical protein